MLFLNLLIAKLISNLLQILDSLAYVRDKNSTTTSKLPISVQRIFGDVLVENSILSFSLWLSTCIDMLSMLLFSTKDISEDTLNTYWKLTSCGAIFISHIGAALSVLWI